MSPARPCEAFWATGLAVLVAAPAVQAQPSAQPTSDARRDAARKFQEGTRAFDAGDYTRAAEAFDAAYALAPHEDSLWNSARSWHRAGELTRAANGYARYLREATPNAADRGGAMAALHQLSAKLARIEVHVGAGVTDAKVDETPIDGPVVYVTPGVHVVRGRTAQGPFEQRYETKEGAVLSVLVAPASSAQPAEPDAQRPPAKPRVEEPPPIAHREEPTRRGWSPIVVVIEGAITLVAVGLTVWSGLDTLSTLHDFDASPNARDLEDGRSKQLRTNILIGTSIGLGVVTGATALWLVDWRGGGSNGGIAVGPLGVRGSF